MQMADDLEQHEVLKINILKESLVDIVHEMRKLCTKMEGEIDRYDRVERVPRKAD